MGRSAVVRLLSDSLFLLPALSLRRLALDTLAAGISSRYSALLRSFRPAADTISGQFVKRRIRAHVLHSLHVTITFSTSSGNRPPTNAAWRTSHSTSLRVCRYYL